MPANPSNSAAFQNRLREHFLEVWRTRLRAILEAWSAQGFLPGQTPPAPDEELALLTEREPELRQTMETTQDEYERLDAARKLLRLHKLRERHAKNEAQ